MLSFALSAPVVLSKRPVLYLMHMEGSFGRLHNLVIEVLPSKSCCRVKSWCQRTAHVFICCRGQEAGCEHFEARFKLLAARQKLPSMQAH